MSYFAGIDWGGSEHAACVVDGRGQVALSIQVRHDSEGLEALCRRLRRIDPEIRVAIERPSGLLVDTLVQAGFSVVPIHPNVVKACRPRYAASCGKHDSSDAYLLADVLRTDGHRFHTLSPLSDELQGLRALVRSRDDLVTERVALANQLRALLESFWPAASSLFAHIDSPISLAFIMRYPTPLSAARLGERRLARFLSGEKYTGRQSALMLLQHLREAPQGRAGAVEQESRGIVVSSLARVLSVLVDEIARLTSRIERAMEELPDGNIVMSLPRAGRLNAAQILAEMGDARERFASDDQLASEAGLTPVTRQSGKSKAVIFRWACNHRLRRAITLWANNSRHECEWANDIYARAKARGCRHPHAIRILARAWVRVLWRMWISRSPYEPERHKSARQHFIASS